MVEHSCDGEVKLSYVSTLLYSTLLCSTLLYSTLLYSTLRYSTLRYSGYAILRYYTQVALERL